MLFIPKNLVCKVCGTRFAPTKSCRYTAATNNGGTGLAGIVGNAKPEEFYDAYDCVFCGCQILVNKRLRRVVCGEIRDESDG